ncbi:MAG: hypothetical protein WB586_30550 [Chthoniobacterales bacterium]
MRNHYLRQIAGAALCFLDGLFALWLSLTIIGLIELGKVGAELLSSLGVRISLAAELALVFCLVAFPLILPWFAAFLPAYLFIPAKFVLWKWWVCTLSGMLAGVLALWIDALVLSLFTQGTLSSINVPLLVSASIPAAILGGGICFTAATGAKFFERYENR